MLYMFLEILCRMVRLPMRTKLKIFLPLSYQIWSSPRLDKNGLLFIGGIDTYLYALRADDGQLVWKYKTDGPVVGTPLITREHAVPQA